MCVCVRRRGGAGGAYLEGCLDAPACIPVSFNRFTSACPEVPSKAADTGTRPQTHGQRDEVPPTVNYTPQPLSRLITHLLTHLLSIPASMAAHARCARVQAWEPPIDEAGVYTP